jgi:hypothetical protein
MKKIAKPGKIVTVARTTIAADESGRVSMAEMKSVPLTALLRADEHNFGCGVGCT